MSTSTPLQAQKKREADEREAKRVARQVTMPQGAPAKCCHRTYLLEAFAGLGEFPRCLLSQNVLAMISLNGINPLLVTQDLREATAVKFGLMTKAKIPGTEEWLDVPDPAKICYECDVKPHTGLLIAILFVTFFGC